MTPLAAAADHLAAAALELSCEYLGLPSPAFAAICETADALHDDNERTPDGMFGWDEFGIGALVKVGGDWFYVVHKDDERRTLLLRPEHGGGITEYPADPGERFVVESPF